MKKIVLILMLMIIGRSLMIAQSCDSMPSFNVVSVSQDIIGVISDVVDREKDCIYYSDTMVFFLEIDKLYNKKYEISVEGISYSSYIKYTEFDSTDNFCFFYRNHMIIMSNISTDIGLVQKTSKYLFDKTLFESKNNELFLLNDSYNIYVFDYDLETIILRQIVKRSKCD